MKAKGDKEKVQKLEEMENAVDEGTREAERYKNTFFKNQQLRAKLGNFTHSDIIKGT